MSGVRYVKELFCRFGCVQEGGFALPSCGGVYEEEDTLVLRYFFPFSVFQGVPSVGLDGLAVNDGGFDGD